jgi:hypothetical protein
MAVLALAAGGALTGGAIGGSTGASIGWAIGGIIGNLLFPQKPGGGGPRLEDLAATTSGYGNPIPRLWGVMRVGGELIWSPDLIERKVKAGGKGGLLGKGAAGQQGYKYFANMAVLLCEGPAQGVLRLWLNDKLVYDATGNSEVTTVPGLRWRFYPGDATQMPDPLIERDRGNETPAYRGRCYIVFERLPLERFGNARPQVSAEVAVGVARTVPVAEFECSQSLAFGVLSVDWASGRFILPRNTGIFGGYDNWDIYAIGQPGAEILRHATTITALAGWGTGRSINGALIPGTTQVVAQGGDTNGRVAKIDVAGNVLVGQFGAATTGGPLIDRLRARESASRIVQVVGTLGVRSFYVLGPAVNTTDRPSPYIIDADAMAYVWGARTAPTGGTLSPEPFSVAHQANGTTILAQGAQRLGETDIWLGNTSTSSGATIELWRVTLTEGASHAGIGQTSGLDYAREAELVPADVGFTGTIHLRGMEYDQVDDSLILLLRQAWGSGAYTVAKWKRGVGFVWLRVLATTPDLSGDPYLNGQSRLTAGTVAFGDREVAIINTATGAVLYEGSAHSSGGTFFAAQAYDAERETMLAYSGSSGANQRLRSIRHNRLTGSTVQLRDIVEDITERSGMDAGEVDATALTDTVTGYAVGRQMSARDAIQPLASAYQFDASEQDDRLVFRKRGGATVATLTYDELVREGAAGVVEETIAQEADLPVRMMVRHIDAARAHEPGAQFWQRPKSPASVTGAIQEASLDLALTLTPSQAKRTARRLITAVWAERTSLRFRTTWQRLALVPGDSIVLTLRDATTQRARITRADIGADYTLRLEAVTESATAYTLIATADGGSGYMPQAIPAPYLVAGFWPDMPLLTSADDLAGGGLRSYVAGGRNPGTPVWAGAALLQSRDGGTSFDVITGIGEAALHGVLQTALPGTTRPNLWDRTTVLDVLMLEGGADLATVAEIDALNGANRAAVIHPTTGAAEIIHFVNVQALANNVYRLTQLVRGRRGTDFGVGAPAAVGSPAGSRLLILDGAVQRVSQPGGDLGVPLLWKMPGPYTDPAALPWQGRTARGRAEQPYSPVRLAATRDGGDNISLTWVRRGRLNAGIFPRISRVPIGETALEYEVEILDAPGGAVVRTFAGLTSAAASYTAAQQVADFGSVQSTVHVRVYQMSGLVGRGIAAEASL